MKSMILRKIPTILLLLFSGILAKGQIIGAEINYQLKGDTLHLQLQSYSGKTAINYKYFPLVLTSENTSSSAILSLKEVKSEDITPICSESCTKYENPQCKNPHLVLRRTHTASIYLASNFSETDCNLSVSWRVCCRSTDNSFFYLKNEINRCQILHNSSPIFTNSPHNIIPVNQVFSQRISATDADGDSLYYSLVPSYKLKNNPIDYEAGLDYSSPIHFLGAPKTNSAYPKGFHLDSKTGLITFTPSKLGKAHLAVKVEEFRKGNKIGEVTRDIAYNIIGQENENPIITGINGGHRTNIDACVGQELSFNIQTEDKDIGDDLALSYETDIPNAAIYVKDGSRPTLSFKWTPNLNQQKKENYYIHIRATDNGCDIVGLYDRIITVNVIEPFEASFDYEIVSCQVLDLLSYVPINDRADYKYTWKINNEQKEIEPNPQIKFDNFGEKVITLEVKDNITGCKAYASHSVFLIEPEQVQISKNIEVCQDEEFVINAKGRGKYQWNYLNNASTKTQATFIGSESGKIYLQSTNEQGCSTYDSASVDVMIGKIDFSIDHTKICRGKTVTIEAHNGENIDWQLYNPEKITDNQAVFKLTDNTNFTLKGEADNGCNAEETIFVEVDKDCVWPGDINGDGLVNNFDILPLGLAFGDMHQTQSPVITSVDYEPFISDNWPFSFENGRNFKHADANGDGRVDVDDIRIIDLNYNSITPVYKTGKKGNKLYFSVAKDSVSKGEKVTVDVKLGTENEQAKNVYGVAFTINYSNYIEESSISFDTKDSWLSQNTNLVQIVKVIPNAGKNNGGKIEVGIARTDKTPISGWGGIGTLEFVVIDVIILKNYDELFTSLQIDNVQLIDELGNDIEAHGESIILPINHDFTSIENKLDKANIQMYPNPSEGWITFDIPEDIDIETIRILDLSGREIQVVSPGNKPIVNLNVSHLKGYYLVRLESKQGFKTLPLVVR